MYILNGITLNPNKGFSYEGSDYPANWLRLSSDKQKEAVGIVEVPEQVSPWYDSRFYYSHDKPRDLDQLKTEFVTSIERSAHTRLKPTDWMVVRSHETNADIPPGVKARRAAIRAVCNEREELVKACTSVEELAALHSSEMPEWPD